jgi:hypothetical protein
LLSTSCARSIQAWMPLARALPTKEIPLASIVPTAQAVS